MKKSLLVTSCETYYEIVAEDITDTIVRLCSFVGTKDRKGPKKCLKKAARGQCAGGDSKAKETQYECTRTCEVHLELGGDDTLSAECAAGEEHEVRNTLVDTSCYDLAPSANEKDSGYCTRKANKGLCRDKDIDARCTYTCGSC